MKHMPTKAEGIKRDAETIEEITPAAPEPVVEAPVAVEPVVEAPVAVEPVVEAPVADGASRPPDTFADLGRAHGRRAEITAEVVNQFEYIRPGPAQVEALEKLRAALIEVTLLLVEIVPACPDRSVALRKLREVSANAQSAIWHRGRY